MANNVTNISETKYAKDVVVQFQQKGYRLKGTTIHATGVRAGTFKFHFLSKGTSSTKATNADVPYMDAAHSDKTATLVAEYAAELLDEEDAKEVSPDMERFYVENTVAAIGRYCDSKILAAAVASHTNLDAGGSFTFTRLLDGIKLLNDQDVEFDGRVYVVTPATVRQALNIEQLTSADYVAMQGVNNGKIQSVLGLNWILSNELTKAGGSPTTQGSPGGNMDQTFLWQKNAIGLASATEITSKIERVAHKDAVQVMTKAKLGAVTIQPLGVIEILVTP